MPDAAALVIYTEADKLVQYLKSEPATDFLARSDPDLWSHVAKDMVDKHG